MGLASQHGELPLVDLGLVLLAISRQRFQWRVHPELGPGPQLAHDQRLARGRANLDFLHAIQHDPAHMVRRPGQYQGQSARVVPSEIFIQRRDVDDFRQGIAHIEDPLRYRQTRHRGQITAEQKTLERIRARDQRRRHQTGWILLTHEIRQVLQKGVPRRTFGGFVGQTPEYDAGPIPIAFDQFAHLTTRPSQGVLTLEIHRPVNRDLLPNQ